MNAHTEIPTAEETRKAGELFDNLRRDLIASEARVADLEAAIREMEAEHGDTVRHMTQEHARALDECHKGYTTEVNDLRRRLHAAEKLNDAQDQRIHVLETNSTIRMLATERMATILGLVRDAVNKGAEEFSTAELDAMERDRELPELPAREEEADEVVIDGVNVRRIDRAEILRRLEQNMAEDDGAPIPQFLRNGPALQAN